MQAVVISGENNSDIKLLLELAQKLGLHAKSLTQAQLEDWMLVQKREEGMQSGEASRSDVMKAFFS